jgi:hypothetical protein
MTDTSTARSWNVEALREAGYLGRGSVWRLTGAGSSGSSTSTDSLMATAWASDVGLDLQIDTSPRRPTDCPILLHLENLPPAKVLPVSMLLDLDSTVGSRQRRHELERLGRTLGLYTKERCTLPAVRAAYWAGDFDSGFVHKDARSFFEGGEGAP